MLCAGSVGLRALQGFVDRGGELQVSLALRRPNARGDSNYERIASLGSLKLLALSCDLNPSSSDDSSLRRVDETVGFLGPSSSDSDEEVKSIVNR